MAKTCDKTLLIDDMTLGITVGERQIVKFFCLQYNIIQKL